MSTKTDEELLKEEIVIKESVRKAYAEFAIKNSLGESCGIESSCCGTPKGVDLPYSKTLGYTDQDLEGMVDGANMGLGCGK
jgi:arsenite methyltransferase